VSSLTQRQHDILARIVQGQPNKIIAADLGISQRTAENHRAAIMRKLGVSSISALIQVALAAC
jgi:two-component system CheB/CheR fusion protein